MLFSSLASASSNFMPPQATEVAAKVDHLYEFLLWTSFIASLIVIVGLIYFAVKYRRRTDKDKTAYITHSTILEFTWSFVPFVFFMVFFAWGWYVFNDLRSLPTTGLEVRVDAQKWYWDFRYKSGKKSTAVLVVPVNTPVKMVLASRDVLHSFYVPAFRIKQDAVPGRYTALWFEANKVGEFQVFCTEYCGDQHSAMLAKVRVLPKAEFEQWLEENPYKGLAPVQVGQKVFEGKCTVCHNATAEKKVGPGLLNIFGREEALADGSKVIADENYIRESILNPNAKVVAGYPAAMPTFLGQLTEDELDGVIEYLKSLKQ